MSPDELTKWINQLIQEDKLYKFYKSKHWLELRAKILQDHHQECINCRAKGRVTKAQTVHHVNHVKDNPGLALSEYYIDSEGNKQRNLLPLCNACHNLEHPEKAYKAYFINKKKNPDTNPERWD